MNTRLSVIGSWLTLSVKALTSYGIDGDSFVRDMGLDPGHASDPNYRIPLAQTRKLWQAAVAATGDEAFGLRAGSFVHPTTFQALGLVMLSSGSLKGFFEYWCRYLSMYSPAGYSTLEFDGEQYIFCGGPALDSDGVPYVHDCALDATIAALVTLCRAHYGEEFSPLRVIRMHSEPAQAEAFEQFYRCPVTYGADAYYLYMSKQQLETPVHRGNPLLAGEMEKLVHDYLARMDREDLIGRIQAKLFELLPLGEVTMDSVADALNMSSRTLRRKLHDKGTTYRELLDDVRRGLARTYLKRPNMSLIDISFMLGFSSSSNFARSFKRWYNQTPLEYRTQVLANS